MASLSRLPSTLMASSKSQVASQRLASLNRQFSSTPSMAFEVKKLGVIGAGQMVRTALPKKSLLLTFPRASESLSWLHKKLKSL